MPRGVLSKDGDTNVSANGYHYTRHQGKWELTHRLIAIKKLGRPIRADETVKFGDSDRTNLSPNNIVVITRRRSVRGRLAAVEAKIMELEAEREELLQILKREKAQV